MKGSDSQGLGDKRKYIGDKLAITCKAPSLPARITDWLNLTTVDVRDITWDGSLGVDGFVGFLMDHRALKYSTRRHLAGCTCQVPLDLRSSGYSIVAHTNSPNYFVSS